jgi:hypothetical protein
MNYVHVLIFEWLAIVCCNHNHKLVSAFWFHFLEQGIISRFGSFTVEFFWYYCCTYTGMPNKFMFVSFSILEKRIISRFGSIVVEFFWYYCCTVTGTLFMIVNLSPFIVFPPFVPYSSCFVINWSVLVAYIFGLLKNSLKFLPQLLT